MRHPGLFIADANYGSAQLCSSYCMPFYPIIDSLFFDILIRVKKVLSGFTPSVCIGEMEG